MAFQSVPGVASFITVISHLGQLCANTYYVHIRGLNWNNSYIDQLNSTVMSWWIENIRGLVTPDTVLTKIVGQRLDTDPTTQRVVFPDGTDGIGTDDSNGAAMPGSVTAAVTWRTDSAGRSYRGRTYHIGLSVGLVAGNQLTGGALSALQAAYAALTAEINGDALFGQVVVSRYANGSKRVEGIHTEITNVTMNSSIDSQRRRLSGRGT